MSKKIFFYIGFFVLLLAAFYLILFAGTDFWRKKLPVMNDVKEFAFVNQLGDTITNQQVAGKVQVVEFFFTTCTGICPKMNTNMLKIASEFKEEEDFLILSHTVDPDKDSVARMKHYADSLQVDHKKWWLLTGTKAKLYEAARHSYLLDDKNNETTAIEEQFIHTQLFALVDKSGNLRGIYDGLKKDELTKLDKDIRLLLKERYSGPRFVNGIFQNSPN
jgi:protein SCO1/2